MNTDKLVSTSKKLHTFFKVLRKIVLIGMVVAILVMALVTAIHFIDPDAVIGEDFHMIDIGPLTIELVQEHAPDTNAILLYSWSLMILGVICAAIVYYAFSVVLRILQPMSQGQPFAPSVGVDIKKMGFVCLALGILQNLANILDTVNAVHTYNLTNMVNNEQIQSITPNYTVNLSFLIFFFVLLLLSHVFRYGAQLQQLSDETL